MKGRLDMGYTFLKMDLGIRLVEKIPNTLTRPLGLTSRDTRDIMAFFEKEIGLNFPWEKYDQVTIRDFTAGGMENTTLTTLVLG